MREHGDHQNHPEDLDEGNLRVIHPHIGGDKSHIRGPRRGGNKHRLHAGQVGKPGQEAAHKEAVEGVAGDENQGRHQEVFQLEKLLAA